jgi:hypothetical protein
MAAAKNCPALCAAAQPNGSCSKRRWRKGVKRKINGARGLTPLLHLADDKIMPPHGRYCKLLSYKKAEMIYDATVCFTRRFYEKRDRSVDQRVQAARSGKQNIIERSMASGTSKETELKLTNVARASLEELLADYQDFLRTHGLAEWDARHPYTLRLRAMNRQANAN